ncbi:hypothetical protein ACF5W4_10990 [Bacillota bacterium Lsc_1132]
MTYEELTNEELIDAFKAAVESLPGGGAYARSVYAEVYEELLDRLNQA